MKIVRQNKNMPVVLGIDWADEKHDTCLWDAEGQTLELDVVEHRPEVLHDWFCKPPTVLTQAEVGA